MYAEVPQSLLRLLKQEINYLKYSFAMYLLKLLEHSQSLHFAHTVCLRAHHFRNKERLFL